MRDVFFDAWRKHREDLPLEGIDKAVVDIALRHPEYHAVLDHPEAHVDRDYLPDAGETNPFLHLGLHVAIHEQLSTDRPAGVLGAYHRLLARLDDAHAVEHRMMECLAEWLWQAQRQAAELPETEYLDCLNRQAR